MGSSLQSCWHLCHWLVLKTLGKHLLGAQPTARDTKKKSTRCGWGINMVLEGVRRNWNTQSLTPREACTNLRGKRGVEEIISPPPGNYSPTPSTKIPGTLGRCEESKQRWSKNDCEPLTRDQARQNLPLAESSRETPSLSTLQMDHPENLGVIRREKNKCCPPPAKMIGGMPSSQIILC